MANRDLLADAIADAKAVKEVAIANAKAALEEAFTPHLKDMLAQKINEMEDLEETDLAEVDKEKQEEAEMKMKKEGYGKKEMEEAYDDSMEEELDLEEILAELELDEAEEVEESEELNEAEEVDEAEEAEEIETEEEVEDDSEEEINLEDMSEEELKSMIEDVIEDMIEDGELVPGPNADESEEEEAADTDDGTEGDADVDIDVDSIDLEEVNKEKEEMKEELEEAKAAIAHLRSELNEVNLLNSKLLYTNKIFRGKNLTENQKIKVLKAFDKAETVKEAKRIFETLNENLVAKTTKSNIRESLGAASKPAGVAPKRNLNEGIVQEDAMVARFKKLAGIN
jgi:hypothetical protein